MNENDIRIVKVDGKDRLVVKRDPRNSDARASSEGDMSFSDPFQESADDQTCIFNLTHNNAVVLRGMFPRCAPSRVLGFDRSLGVGDRLGIAAGGHINVFKKYDAYPVLAQQSIRELNLTNRTYEDVLDAAVFAVFKTGFDKPWGADGDHLKKPEDIAYALSLGFTMITLDCSDHIKVNVTRGSAPPLDGKIKEKYLGKSFDIGEGHAVAFNDEKDLARIAAVYGAALNFAVDMYDKFLRGRNSADFEISIDETSAPTTPQEHYFVARELTDRGVTFVTMAPRFCGEFQKGIDYSGDLAQFEKELKVHAAIARHLGYKLSIHSGSDKFSVFPAIGKETRGRFHVKTAGTNWLEAMKIAVEKDPALYREVHRFALANFAEAKKYYHVTTDLSAIPDIGTLNDGQLPGLFADNNARQLIHITYGLILGVSDYREKLYALWDREAGAYAEAVEKHIGKHLDLLGVTHA